VAESRVTRSHPDRTADASAAHRRESFDEYVRNAEGVMPPEEREMLDVFRAHYSARAAKTRFRGSSLVCSECGWQISYRHRPGCTQAGMSASELMAPEDATRRSE